MSDITLTVPETLDGERLDKCIVQLYTGATRARVRRAIEESQVRVNGKRGPKSALVHTGDVITFPGEDVSHEMDAALPDPNTDPHVVYQDESVIVCNKPAGMPCMPLRPGELGTLASALLAKFPELEGFGYGLREPGLLHRLDTDTSGLVVFARTAAVFENLRESLEDRLIEKEYLVICEEANLTDRGVIEVPLTNHPKDQRRVLACIHPRDVMRLSPRPAVTQYEVLDRKGRWALVKVRLNKASRHQIRAHFAHVEAPLAGDTLYGGPEVPGLTRHALHASRVRHEPRPSFDVRADLPADMAALLADA